jgi:predicted acetyltransferase
MLKLVAPTVGLQDPYLDMLSEWKPTGEKLIPWVLSFDTSDFPQMVEQLNGYARGIGIGEGRLPHSTYWAVLENNRVVGAVNIRHQLNDFMLIHGGHIGYGVRPTERRKGYATEMLRQALDIAKNIGIDRVFIMCNKTNVGSAKTILKNGGVFDSEITRDDETIHRYWITL